MDRFHGGVQFLSGYLAQIQKCLEICKNRNSFTESNIFEIILTNDILVKMLMKYLFTFFTDSNKKELHK